MTTPLPPGTEGLLTSQKAARRARLAVNTFYQYAQRSGLVPAATVGRIKLYRPEDIDAWVKRPSKPRGRPAGLATRTTVPPGHVTSVEIIAALSAAGIAVDRKTIPTWVCRGLFPRADVSRKGHPSCWRAERAEAGIAEVLRRKRKS